MFDQTMFTLCLIRLCSLYVLIRLCSLYVLIRLCSLYVWSDYVPFMFISDYVPCMFWSDYVRSMFDQTMFPLCLYQTMFPLCLIVYIRLCSLYVWIQSVLLLDDHRLSVLYMNTGKTKRNISKLQSLISTCLTYTHSSNGKFCIIQLGAASYRQLSHLS